MLLFVSNQVALADRVVMKNGDCVTGTVIKAERELSF